MTGMRAHLQQMFVLLTLAIAPIAAAQQQPFEESVDVNLVLVDATVTDRAGNQILGLTRDDFIVREEGVQQELASVEYFTNRRLLTTPESKAAFQVERVREERYFILFFHRFLDSPGTFRSELMKARTEAQKFIRDRALPQDRIAIAGYDARLKVYADFTSDKRVLERALNDAITFAGGLVERPSYAGDDSIMTNIDRRRMINDTGRIYDAIEMLADAMPKIAARKAMVLFSPGIGQASSFSPDIAENEDVWYDPMLRALNRANISVYPVNILRNAGLYAEEQTLSRLASETGGEYFKSVVNYGTPLRLVEKENSGYYLLTYYTRRPKGSHGYQRIDVSIRNPEFRLKAREGYAY